MTNVNIACENDLPQPLVVVVCESTPLVAIDLAEQIAETAPDASVHHATSPEAAVALIAELASVDVAIFDVDAMSLRKLPNWADVETRIRTILVRAGSGVEDDPRFVVLRQPFGMKDLSDHVRRP